MTGQAFLFELVSLALLVVVLILRIQRRRDLRAVQDRLDELSRLHESVDNANFNQEEMTTSTYRVDADDLCRSILNTGQLISGELTELRQDRGLLRAILASMSQGVIALDSTERVLMLNPAGCDLLDTNEAWAMGRPIQEILRSPALQSFVQRTLTESTDTSSHTEDELSLPVVIPPDSGEAAVHPPVERIVMARGQALLDATGAKIGVLLVLSDITRLRRLEQVRQDFVANVSHELRTPITAIRGSVETLMDGSEHDRETTARFLSMIGRHADRLNDTLADLLCLARLDSEPKSETKTRDRIRGRNLAQRAIEACSVAADKQRMTIHLECEDDIYILVDEKMMEQALINLIQNAIKYSPEGGDITVFVDQTQAKDESAIPAGSEEVVFSVVDHGIGIPRDHQVRIFERFYRVDKGRSREVGGTGLGLSIVKHVALTHGGRVSVESEPGVGSTFRIHLPIIE